MKLILIRKYWKYINLLAEKGSNSGLLWAWKVNAQGLPKIFLGKPFLKIIITERLEFRGLILSKFTH